TIRVSTLSIHDALPIYAVDHGQARRDVDLQQGATRERRQIDDAENHRIGHRPEVILERDLLNPDQFEVHQGPEEVGENSSPAPRSEEHTSELQSRENLV